VAKTVNNLGWSILMVACWATMGCRRGIVEVPVSVLEVPVSGPVDALPSGQVIDGRFVDNSHQFSVAMLPGWFSAPMRDDVPIRFSAIHDATESRFEVWFFGERLSKPAPRSDCDWEFADHGDYRSVPITDLYLVATCTPHQSHRPRVFAGLVEGVGGTWQLELHIPVRELAEGLTQGRNLLETVRF